jgi:hypothetical protein
VFLITGALLLVLIVPLRLIVTDEEIAAAERQPEVL